MTLKEYIADLTRLMKHYHAEDFEVMTRDIEMMAGSETEIYGENRIAMTGDNFWLNLEDKKMYVDCCFDGEVVQKSSASYLDDLWIKEELA